jgi:hypothetical protein
MPPGHREALERAIPALGLDRTETLKLYHETPHDDREVFLCAADRFYFIDTYCRIYDSVRRSWIPFRLWPAQGRVLETVTRHQLSIILKSRQLGMTWLMLAYGLHEMLFRPIAEFLIFSKREDEALYLLAEYRLKGMFANLPTYLKQRKVTDNGHQLALANGSVARAFPSNAGDSYTATLALVDEADLVPNLEQLLNRVKPTIDAGGKLVLLSRADKSRPNSPFKQIYRAAKTGENEYAAVFLGWNAHPKRTRRWYDKQRADSLANTGSYDSVDEQYPETDVQALAARTLDKRIPGTWLGKVSDERRPLEDVGMPAIPGLRVYILPQPDQEFVIGADPAEGNPTSDDSALTVLDRATGEEAALLSGKFDPAVFSAHIDAVGRYFNDAAVLPERNNHGHAIILWLRDNSSLRILNGWDRKPGWLSNAKGKSLMYDGIADAIRQGDILLHSWRTITQLASIEGSTLRAPEGQMDDCADAIALAHQARVIPPPRRAETW